MTKEMIVCLFGIALVINSFVKIANFSLSPYVISGEVTVNIILIILFCCVPISVMYKNISKYKKNEDVLNGNSN